MGRRLKNVRCKAGYRQYCGTCGQLATTTGFPVYASYNVFCSKKCEGEYYSLRTFLAAFTHAAGWGLMVLAPWLAAFYVDKLLGFTGLGLAVGFGAFVLVMLAVSFPLRKWLDR